MRVMSFTTAPNSLTYILLCGDAALRWAEAPGRSGLVPQPETRNRLTAYSVMPRIRKSVRFSFLRPLWADLRSASWGADSGVSGVWGM